MHVRVLTGQVAAEDLHPHADPSRRPPLWKHSDVLGHYLIKPPHLWSIVVAVSLENLRADVDSDVIGAWTVIRRCFPILILQQGKIRTKHFLSSINDVFLPTFYILKISLCSQQENMAAFCSLLH